MGITPGAPVTPVPSKRSFDVVPVTFDWHDFLAAQRTPGAAVALDFVFRPLRAQATGLQYRCTVAGVASGAAAINLPTVLGGTVVDGGVTWTAEALSDASMRTTITGSAYSEPSNTLTLEDSGVADFVYTVLAGGGSSGREYKISHEVELQSGESKEAIAILPVKD
jgi:hypothetical protein